MAEHLIRFAGYAALFDLPDADHDTIRPGAFSDTLAQRKTSLPLLWQHRPSQRIGTVEYAAEDARGLRVIATIENRHSRSGAMLQHGQISGLSFGYRAKTSRFSERGRELLAIDLFEVSLVTRPLQHRARVHFVI